MKIQWLSERMNYDGRQLRPHWIFQTTNILGDALVAFQGGCHVATDQMVDLVDQKDGKKIYSEEMLHFIGEFFGADLSRTILVQRLLVSLAQQEIIFRAKTTQLIRAGNDLFEGDAKLSVSIATASPVSTLIHFGINVSSKNTPVKTKGLLDYGLDPAVFAQSLLETFKHEVESVSIAQSKVRPVS
ncbi:MAG: DUF366 family protein [Deltaproteobacteria bacterium]|nr:DUF366 family protein [Deltaproteobacteria bacterium]MBI2501362.1 DUF366 family protein [Deltaproteobacteria bacterium]